MFVRSRTPRITMAVIFFVLAIISVSCTPTRRVKKWIDWNVLFEPGADSAGRANALKNIRRFIIDSGVSGIKADSAYNAYVFSIDSTSIQTEFCFCDTLLHNISADLIIYGSGNTQQTPPKGGGPIPSGGELVREVSNNTNVNAPKENSLTGAIAKREIVRPISVNDSFILAIIDTGIDSALFEQPGITNILWQGTEPFPQNRNFVSAANRTSFLDDDREKHGSAVAAIAIECLQEQRIYPRLMILKAFDANRVSSNFSVSCAIKYAIIHNATLINASWGYYGQPQTVLLDYVRQAAFHHGGKTPIPIIAAAGNDTSQTHVFPNICSPQSNELNTILGRSRWYFPACYGSTQDVPNIISVTGLRDTLHQCYYQNFSAELISVGVINTNNENRMCCAYRPGYMPVDKIMEGSSFATPVITGKVMAWVLQHGLRSNVSEYLRGIGVQRTASARFTIAGQYFIY